MVTLQVECSNIIHLPPWVMKNKKNVDLLFRIYKGLYGLFDKVIYLLDSMLPESKKIPKF